MATADEIFRQALAAHQTGDVVAAESSYRQLLEAIPDHAPTLSNLASLVARRGETAEAEQLYRRAIAANPDLLDAHFNLGNLYRKLGRARDATIEYEESLRIAPDSPQSLVNLGLVLGDTGHWSRAVECFARAVTVSPRFPEPLVLLGDALSRCGRREEAIAAFRESVARFPDFPRGHLYLGLHLAGSGAIDDAIPAFERALALNPDYAEAHNALGVAFDSTKRADDAQREYRESLRVRPNFAEALRNLGVSLGEQGLVAEAIDSLRRAIAIAPNAVAGSTLLTNLMFSASVTPEQLRDEHFSWAEQYANSLATNPPPKRSPNTPGRIRVGYVCGEFRSRAAVAFLESLLAHHDRTQFHITAYVSTIRQNESLSRLRRLADTWKPVTHLSDEQLADAIRADEIDILVDLNGHTSGNRLLVFARKPAATQISLFGYPGTTGLKTMDYRVTDAITDPPGEAEQFYSEKLLRLPDLSWVYVPPGDAPAPSALPAAGRRSFTFGCLNHPGKLSAPCFEAWAAILKAVPKSRLVLLAGQSVAAAESLAARFTQLGVASERLELVYRLPESEYFAAYQLLDLALDPFPYCGAVTTCDALWMGVPMLTVAGRDARGRQGVSLLNAIGLPEFVADSPEQLVSLATTWAEQRESLAEVRNTLRDMMTQSPVTAVAAYVKHLEAAYRSV